ncbi:hypothetical protein AGLY_011037 [Aphis glycines]|uniref:Uncharacterized protein n=1 Tax=Aphis glycines TaxID=307491 RepID=A0A6G0TD79_APHGL|nr:hypothetical protein AGLY_011037 [Aphis glycines]
MTSRLLCKTIITEYNKIDIKYVISIFIKEIGLSLCSELSLRNYKNENERLSHYHFYFFSGDLAFLEAFCDPLLVRFGATGGSFETDGTGVLDLSEHSSSFEDSFDSVPVSEDGVSFTGFTCSCFSNSCSTDFKVQVSDVGSSFTSSGDSGLVDFNSSDCWDSLIGISDFIVSSTDSTATGVVGGVGAVIVGVSGVFNSFKISLDRSSFSSCLTARSLLSISISELTGGIVVDVFFKADFNGFGSSVCTTSGAVGVFTATVSILTSGVLPRVSEILDHILEKLSLPK